MSRLSLGMLNISPISPAIYQRIHLQGQFWPTDKGVLLCNMSKLSISAFFTYKLWCQAKFWRGFLAGGGNACCQQLYRQRSKAQPPLTGTEIPILASASLFKSRIWSSKGNRMAAGKQRGWGGLADQHTSNQLYWQGSDACNPISMGGL